MKTFKIFRNILVGSACIFSTYSCTDLVEDPVGQFAPESFFKSEKDVETAIFGAYSILSDQNQYGRRVPNILLYRSDLVAVGGWAPAYRYQVNDFDLDANNTMIGLVYPLFWQIISAANSALYGIEQIEATDEVKNALRAEARFLRAHTYYDLVRWFGEVPLIEAFVTDPSAVSSQSKASVGDIYSSIIADLEFGKQYLPDQQENGIRSRPTKGTAASYLASVYLTTEQWQNAYDEAKWVIDNSATFNYSLASDFQDLFDGSKVSELLEPIFTIDFKGNYNVGLIQNNALGRMLQPDWAMLIINGAEDWQPSSSRGFSSAVPSMEVFDDWDDQDYRKWVSFDTSTVRIDGSVSHYTQFGLTPRPHVAKFSRFPGPEAQLPSQNTDQDYILMRYSEVLLIAAEALAEISGVTTEATGYVNQVRARARNYGGTPTTYPADVPGGLSSQEFIDLILEERKVEFAFEWKRWYDIVRRDLGDEVFQGPGSLEPQENFNKTRDYLFPIPGNELDRYPNLLPQNPGY